MDIRLTVLVISSLVLAACGKSETPSAKSPSPQTQVTKKRENAPRPDVKKPTTPDPKALAAAATLVARYQAEAEKLVADITAEKPVAAVAELAARLTRTGIEIAPLVSAKHPGCDAYLEAVIAAAPTMHTLPLAEIESGYHKDGKLPKNSQGECYHAKDLVVHPATVAAISRQGLETAEDRASAKGEIVEVLTHLGQIRAALGVKN